MIYRAIREEGTEQTNWAHVVRVTRDEILRRGFSSRDLPRLGAADQEGRERVLRAFRAERDQKRRQARNGSDRPAQSAKRTFLLVDSSTLEFTRTTGDRGIVV